MWTVHDAYTRLSPSRRIVRIVAVNPRTVEIVDHVEGPPVSVDLAVPLHPHVSWDAAASMVELDGERFDFELPPGDVAAVRGSEEPYAGWWSGTYGRAEPATVIQTRCDASRPIRWVVQHLEDRGTDASPREASLFASSVLFDETKVHLCIEVNGRTWLRSA
jgi:hypothetical protein